MSGSLNPSLGRGSVQICESTSGAEASRARDLRQSSAASRKHFCLLSFRSGAPGTKKPDGTESRDLLSGLIFISLPERPICFLLGMSSFRSDRQQCMHHAVIPWSSISRARPRVAQAVASSDASLDSFFDKAGLTPLLPCRCLN